MPHTKLQGHRPFGSRKEDLKVFQHIWAWWASWSSDINHLYSLSVLHPMETPCKIWLQSAYQFFKEKKFEYVESE